MAKRNNPRMSRKARNFWRSAALVFLSVTLSFVLLGIFGEGISNPFKGDRNSDNLLLVNDTYIESHNTNHGVEVDVDDDGTIKLSGTATSDYSVTVQTFTLSAGTYTLSGLDDPDVNKFYMYASYGAGEAIAGTDSATFTIDADTEVSVILTWKNEYDFTKFFMKTKVQPVLVKGETAGEFYKD